MNYGRTNPFDVGRMGHFNAGRVQVSFRKELINRVHRRKRNAKLEFLVGGGVLVAN